MSSGSVLMLRNYFREKSFQFNCSFGFIFTSFTHPFAFLAPLIEAHLPVDVDREFSAATAAAFADTVRAAAAFFARHFANAATAAVRRQVVEHGDCPEVMVAARERKLRGVTSAVDSARPLPQDWQAVVVPQVVLCPFCDQRATIMPATRDLCSKRLKTIQIYGFKRYFGKKCKD